MAEVTVARESSALRPRSAALYALPPCILRHYFQAFVVDFGFCVVLCEDGAPKDCCSDPVAIAPRERERNVIEMVVFARVVSLVVKSDHAMMPSKSLPDLC